MHLCRICISTQMQLIQSELINHPGCWLVDKGNTHTPVMWNSRLHDLRCLIKPLNTLCFHAIQSSSLESNSHVSLLWIWPLVQSQLLYSGNERHRPGQLGPNYSNNARTVLRRTAAVTTCSSPLRRMNNILAAPNLIGSLS